MRMINLFKILLTAAVVLTLLAGCVPQTSPSYNQGLQPNLTMEMRRLQGTLASQERSLQELNQEVVDLNARLDLQQRELDELRNRGSLTTMAKAAPLAAVSSPGMTHSAATTVMPVMLSSGWLTAISNNSSYPQP
jgi:uncharacterized coiled-coil protein SlyX